MDNERNISYKKMLKTQDRLNTPESVSIKNYFDSHNWIEKKCRQCGNPFLAKPKNESVTCGREDCSTFEFLKRPERKRFLGVTEFHEEFKEFFSRQGYIKADPVSVVNETGSTLFAGTGGQIFDEAIFSERAFNTKPNFVTQPVIRLQGKDLVGVREGFSTSFLNIALEQLNPSIEEHVNHVDDWLNFISKMGLFMGEMTVRIVSDKPVWGSHGLDAITVKMYYGGLEIGVANWFEGIPQRTRNALCMSDISFGLERVVWVINKCASYFDVIGPLGYSVKGEKKIMDSYRTAVLMSLSGVEPGNKDRSSKLRALIKNITDEKEEISEDLILFYAKWWKQFAEFPVPLTKIIQTISGERNRNINLGVKKDLGITDSIPTDISPLEYIQRTIDFGIPFKNIKEFLARKKNRI